MRLGNNIIIVANRLVVEHGILRVLVFHARAERQHRIGGVNGSAKALENLDVFGAVAAFFGACEPLL